MVIIPLIMDDFQHERAEITATTNCFTKYNGLNEAGIKVSRLIGEDIFRFRWFVKQHSLKQRSFRILVVTYEFSNARATSRKVARSNPNEVTAFFSIDLILPATLWPCSLLKQREIELSGGNVNRSVRHTTSAPSMSRLSRKRWSLDISKLSWLPRPVTGIALLLFPYPNIGCKACTKLNSMVCREWTIPTERPPLVGEVIANFLRV
jgi:hypothetical protein